MEALERRVASFILIAIALIQGASGVLSEDDEVVKRYAQSMARCMAALSKLAYCNLPPEAMGDALQESCGTPCSWAGMDLEPHVGSRLVAKQADGKGLDFGFVAKFTRAEGINEASMAASGCIVALKGPDDESTAFDVTVIKAAVPEEEASMRRLADLGILVPPLTVPMAQAVVPQSPHLMEVWESDAFCAGCQVAASYKRAWQGLKQRLADHLLDAGCKPADAVYVTGHSKGAALATLAMFSLQAQMGYHVQLSYNFESPRVGNVAFAKAFDQLFCGPKGPLGKVALYRITHTNDKAVRQPATKWGYMHVGQQVWYSKEDAETDYVFCGNATTGPDCGAEAIPRNLTCPLQPTTMCFDKSCAEDCQEDAPRGGPHCRHPLAPARSFCPFGDNQTENWGSEWNEVVRSGEERADWEKTCTWGQLPVQPTPPPGELPAVPIEVPLGPPTSTTPMPTPGGKHHEVEVGVVTSPPPSPPPAAVVVPDVANRTACFERDVTYQPLDMSGHYFSVESDAETCQNRCAGIEACAYFSFFPRGTSGDCHVAAMGSYRQQGSIGFIAGPQTCESSLPEDIGSLTPYGPSNTLWYLPGVAAACILATYFLCLAGLAMSGGKCDIRRQPEGYRSALLHEPMSSSTVPMVGTENVAAAL